MEFLFLILGLQIFQSECSQLVNYKFGLNFGQIFYDYSESGNYGQNGASTSVDTSDTIPTKTGAYFSTTNDCFIKLPPNSIKSSSISIGPTFSIVMWLNSLDNQDVYILNRFKDSSNYFYLKRIEASNYLIARISRESYDSADKVRTSESLIKGNSKLEKWNYLIMVNEGATTKFYAKNTQILAIIQTSSYSESGSFEHYIGYTSTSFEGIMWSFHLYNSIVNPSDFYSSSYTPGNCLVQICPVSCNPSFKFSSGDYCMSIVFEYTCTSCLYGCKDGVCLDCSGCSSFI